MRRPHPKQFLKDLYLKVGQDNVYNGAAALAYYLTLSIFPAIIFLLSLLPYLPIAHLDQAIMDLVGQVLPRNAAQVLWGVVYHITNGKKGGLLSLGLLGTLWAASTGTYAAMQQINLTYEVRDRRPYWKLRSIALGLTLALGVLVLSAFILIVLGGEIQDWLAGGLGRSRWLLAAFAIFRWVVIAAALLLAFAILYYFGPDVEQKFSFITPGSAIGTVLLAVATLGFRAYASNFGHFDATYGSLGAVIVLMLWLYLTGLVVLVGSEINAILEHFSPEGKKLGQKQIDKAA